MGRRWNVDGIACWNGLAPHTGCQILMPSAPITVALNEGPYSMLDSTLCAADRECRASDVCRLRKKITARRRNLCPRSSPISPDIPHMRHLYRRCMILHGRPSQSHPPCALQDVVRACARRDHVSPVPITADLPAACQDRNTPQLWFSAGFSCKSPMGTVPAGPV